MDLFSKKPSSQDNITRESVSNDTTQPVTTEPIAQSSTTPPVVHKEKHSRAFSFVSVLFLLMLLVAGVMTYLWYNQAADVDSLKQELGQAKTDQDALKKQVADLKKDGTTDVVTEPAKSDDDLIKEAVITYNHAYKDAEKQQYTVIVTKKEGAFAWASFGTVPPSGGAKCLLKKVDSTWLVLLCGQDTPLQSDLDKWGVPKSFTTGA